MAKAVTIAALLMGFLVGLLTGLSNSAVVAAVLPLLFGLLGGASGFQLLRSDTSTATMSARIRMAGGASAAFATTCIVGLGYGIASRSPAGWSALVPSNGLVASAPVALPVESNLDSEDLIDLAILDRKLAAVGVERPDRMRVMSAAAAQLREANRAASASPSLAPELAQLVAELKPHTEPTDRPEALYKTWLRLETLVVSLSAVPPEARLDLLTDATRLLRLLRDDDDTLVWLGKRSFATARLYETEAKFRLAHPEVLTRWRSDGDLGRSLTELVDKLAEAQRNGGAGLALKPGAGRGLASNP